MTKELILKQKPWLRLCNINSISDRISERTNGNAFIVFNLIQQNYELHTVEAYMLSGDSYNASLPLEFLNNFILIDYRLHNNKTNGEEVLSERVMLDRLNAKHEAAISDNSSLFKSIERTLGTKV